MRSDLGGRGAERGRAMTKLDEGAAQIGKLGVGVDEPLREQAQLTRRLLRVGGLSSRQRTDRLRDARPLGLQRQRPCVTVCEAVLQVCERRRVLASRGRVEKRLEALQESVVAHEAIIRRWGSGGMGRAAHLCESPVPPFLTLVRSGPENAAVRRRIVTVVAVSLALFAAATSAHASLGGRLGAALAGAGIDPSRYGAMVVDLRTGKLLFAQRPWLSLEPASNEKLAITFAALEALGPAYRIETDVLGAGRLDGTTWRGHLYLRGRGDPTLSKAGLAQLAAQLRDAGIARVTGAIIGDESFFDARRTAFGWKRQFYINESPPLSALAVDRSDSAEPAAEAAAAFRAALRSAGIAVSGPAGLGRSPARSFPLAAIVSPPLRDIVRVMDTESDNYTAELLLKQLGAVIARVGTGPAGAAVVMSVLAQAGVPVQGIRVVDGSGLSRLDRLTAGGLVALLKEAFADPLVRPTFVAALAVAGRTGTLEDRLNHPPARGNVLAKTGTTNAASALSGFVKLRYAFAIIQNGNPVPRSAARAAQDRFATILAGQ